MSILLGAIADDFTGATDLCSTLVNEGMRVVQVTGVPDGIIDIGDAQAVVVALKSRTAPTADAIEDSLGAARWLRGQGAQQILFKYCSTFDSTTKGNIGPVADALRSELNAAIAVVCPAFPENGRVVRDAELYVNGQLLSESSMRDHPLTPMHDSHLVRLMQAQCEGTVAALSISTVEQGAPAIEQALKDLQQAGVNYVVPDATTVEHLRAIGHASHQHHLITGASGIARGLPDNYRTAGLLGPANTATVPQIPGRKLALAGSASTATRAQIAYIAKRWPTRQIGIDEIVENPSLCHEVMQWLNAIPTDTPALVYGSGDPEQVKRNQEKHGAERAGALLERCLSDIAVAALAAGTTQLIVAGGETSGAVVSALEVQALHIGTEICPGVPWTQTVAKKPIALALKSGNFGGEDFFEQAFKALT